MKVVKRKYCFDQSELAASAAANRIETKDGGDGGLLERMYASQPCLFVTTLRVCSISRPAVSVVQRLLSLC